MLFAVYKRQDRSFKMLDAVAGGKNRGDPIIS